MVGWLVGCMRLVALSMYVARSRDKLGRSLVFETVARFRTSALAAAKFAMPWVLDSSAGSAPPQRDRSACVHDTRPGMAQFRGGRPVRSAHWTDEPTQTAAHTPACCAQNDEEDPDDYYAKNSETQKLLMRDQDDTLKMLGSAVDRVQSMARQVNQELSDQNQMLDTIDDEVDKTESKLASVHKSLKMLANDTDRGKYCVICLLIVLLVWLVMMVLD